MAVCFKPGYETQRNDLSIFLVNEYGVPTDAAEIFYAIYFVDVSKGMPGVEILIGPAKRTPVHPSVGEYYAAFFVPMGAAVGTYRIRWTFKRTVNGEDQVVVQEFGVDDPNACATGQKVYSACVASLIDKLRIMLRDNCIAGEEQIVIDVDGTQETVTLAELWDILKEEGIPRWLSNCSPTNPTPSEFCNLDKTVGPIREAFHAGTLKVKTVDNDGQFCWRKIGAVRRIENEQKMVEVRTRQGISRMTTDHRVFVSLCKKIEAGLLHEAWNVGETTVSETNPDTFVYDLTVEDPSRFILENSGLLVSNSPDRNYKFRPPEQEGVIGRYNRVFGYIWEDYELQTYLEMSLNWFMSMPPSTMNIQTLDQLCSQMPGWTTWILWGAAVHALFALATNWVADEFSYSIGGISLDISKSSQYESLKQNAEGQVDKAAEYKARTVKFIRGLQQPRFGMGVRSSFGPNVGRGVLSPRSFVG